MNYKHLYHAGNFADVFKHIVLLALIQSFHRKETPFCYLETHAGAGVYDLLSEEAQINKEFASGIEKIYSATDALPLVYDYLNSVRALNTSTLHYYPGSPYFAKQRLRQQDRMVLCEKQVDAYRALKNLFSSSHAIHVHQQDGYASLSAFLPPKERRGLIFIDPPYEKADEFSLIVTALKKALQRFETGVYAIWYPIKTRREVDLFHQQIKKTITRPMLLAELSIYPENLKSHLNGSGLLIINPPWQVDTLLINTLPWLLEKLNINQGHYCVRPFFAPG